MNLAAASLFQLTPILLREKVPTVENRTRKARIGSRGPFVEEDGLGADDSVG